MNTNLKAALVSLLIAGSAFAASALLSGCATVRYEARWAPVHGKEQAQIDAEVKECALASEWIDPYWREEYKQRCLKSKGYKLETVAVEN